MAVQIRMKLLALALYLYCMLYMIDVTGSL